MPTGTIEFIDTPLSDRFTLHVGDRPDLTDYVRSVSYDYRRHRAAVVMEDAPSVDQWFQEVCRSGVERIVLEVLSGDKIPIRRINMIRGTVIDHSCRFDRQDVHHVCHWAQFGFERIATDYLTDADRSSYRT